MSGRQTRIDMATNEQRLSMPEQKIENEQEWRRDMVADKRFDRLESNQRWLFGLLITILVAIIASNWIGQVLLTFASSIRK